MGEVKVRLHATAEMEDEPVLMIIQTPVPPEIILHDEELGFDVRYALRKRYLPGNYDSQEATADYVLKGVV